MEYSLVFHSSRKPQSVRCSFTSHSHTTENSIESWNYIDIKNNSVWRSNCPSVYLSPPPGLCSYCNWFPVLSIFLQISNTVRLFSQDSSYLRMPQAFGSLINQNGLLMFWILPQEEGHNDEYYSQYYKIYGQIQEQ